MFCIFVKMRVYTGADLESVLNDFSHIYLRGVVLNIGGEPGNLQAKLTAELVFPEKPPCYKKGRTAEHVTLGELGIIVDQARQLLYRTINLNHLSGSEGEGTPRTYTEKGMKVNVQNPIPRENNRTVVTLEHQMYRPLAGEHFVYYDLSVGDFVEEQRTMILGF
jgi:hypothetical protein